MPPRRATEAAAGGGQKRTLPASDAVLPAARRQKAAATIPPAAPAADAATEQTTTTTVFQFDRRWAQPVKEIFQSKELHDVVLNHVMNRRSGGSVQVMNRRFWSVLDRWHPEMGSQQLRNVGRSLLWVRPGQLPLRDPGL